MKKLLLLMAVCCALSAAAQTTVKMKSTKAEGEEFSFTVNPGVICYVDWGDGVTDTIKAGVDPIVGTVKGSSSTKTVTLKAPGLTYLDCSGQLINQMTFTAATSLETLIISNNKMFSFSTSGLTGLKTFWCDNNLFTQLDIRGLSNLESLVANNCMLSKLTLPTSNAQLTDVWVNYNRFTTLDLSGCNKLKTLNVEKNLLKSMSLGRLSEKGLAVFMEGNSLDFTSLWNKININKWYGMEQTIPFAKSVYQIGQEVKLDRNLFGSNQDGVDQPATAFTFTWYQYNADGTKGAKLTRGNPGVATADYSTPNTTTEKNAFTFNRAFDDLQLEIKDNKYLNFLILSNHIEIEDPTGLNEAKAQGLTWKKVSDGLLVESSKPTDVKIYNAQGQLCWQGTVEGPVRIPLLKGIYIINNCKVSL